MLYSLLRHVVKMGAHPGYLILHRNGFQDIIKDDILEERGVTANNYYLMNSL